MFFYEVGYIDWDSNNTVVLWHQEEFSEEEFTEIMLQCYVKISQELENKWSEFNDPLVNHNWRPSVSEINSHIVELLVSEWNFNKIKITAEFVPFESHDLKDIGEKKESEIGDDRALLALFKRFSKTEIRNDRIDDVLRK